MINIVLACLWGYMTKFKTLHWNDYEIRLLHHKDGVRRVINLIPYFWDDEVHYTLAIRQLKNAKRPQDVWEYKWRLLDLDGNRIKDGRDIIDIIPTKWMRRYFGGYWTSGKSRAIVLGNLSPNRYYILKINFTNEMGESIEQIMATFSTKDRADFYMQIFLILFSIFAALFFSVWLKGCGL